MESEPAHGAARGALRLALAAASFGLPVPAAEAGVVVHATRVVYPAARKEVTVDLRNEGAAPALVQAWIEADAERAPDRPAEVPFALGPAIFRLDPASGQSLRILYTGKPLPADRESVFWLNVLDIPPKAPANPDAPNRLDFAFRHRMKLFFRPAGLKGRPEQAAASVGWSLRNDAAGTVLVAVNPAPYHVSLVRIDLSGSGWSAAAAPVMLAPLSTTTIPLAKPVQTGAVRVRYAFVDDFGATREAEATAPGGTPAS
ncbi:molecular chaperone [Novosphingobium flavum]|uniref:Molecular chaperone n=1 Tax=Novosphingobium flavum TaxID=1778672 RepID=A0A7X1FTQ7_9SPHN|nr:molecular chaperone [Novosphingobium flavum]MBC2666811.1 molecular chaperone [Novosphingobium flavum]